MSTTSLLLIATGGAFFLGSLVLAFLVGFFSRGGPKSQPSPEGRLKGFLAAVSAILGIVSTTVGILKDCSGQEQPVVPTTQPVFRPQPNVSLNCCTAYGPCQLFAPAQVGAPCTCITVAGYVSGTVCE